jgi:hypothetical protein
VSHGDHLSVNSIADLQASTFLLADHRGGRIKADLTAMGFGVRVLPERQWVPISPRIRIMTLSDCNQDSILLVDLDGVLIVNPNDAGPVGGEHFLRSVASRFKTAFLMRLWGEGAADMSNVFTEFGERLANWSNCGGRNVGRLIQADLRRFRATHAIPFSSFHRFQREDSVWANEFLTPLEAYYEGVDPQGPEILPAFIRYDRTTSEVTRINPTKLTGVRRTALECGDNWSDPLEADERADLIRYF